MSNEKQFEQWCQSVMTDDADFCMEYGMYINYSVRLYWQAWQAATHAASTKLTSQLESVVAENAALKLKGREMLSEAAVVYKKHNELIHEPWGAMVDCQTLHEFQEVIESETPVTSAFLAEVRASGADECVRQLVTSDDDGFSDAPNICAMVAHQLRKGVQS